MATPHKPVAMLVQLAALAGLLLAALPAGPVNGQAAAVAGAGNAFAGVRGSFPRWPLSLRHIFTPQAHEGASSRRTVPEARLFRLLSRWKEAGSCSSKGKRFGFPKQNEMEAEEIYEASLA